MKLKGNVKTIVCLYVDDFFVFTNSKPDFVDLRQRLGKVFKINDLGEIKNCLGMRVNYDKENNVMTLDQEHYVDQLLKNFGMVDSKDVNTPMENGLNLAKIDVDCKDQICSVPYQQLIGSLMYLSVLTRPDISFSVSYLSQFNNCYTEEHWKHAKRILRYLKATKKLGLKFSKNDKYLECFVFSFQEAPLHGKVKNKRPLLSRVQRPSTWQFQKLPKRLYI